MMGWETKLFNSQLWAKYFTPESVLPDIVQNYSLHSFFFFIYSGDMNTKVNRSKLIVEVTYSNQIKSTDMCIQDWSGHNVLEK